MKAEYQVNTIYKTITKKVKPINNLKPNNFILEGILS